jgi:hypothetical protein
MNRSCESLPLSVVGCSSDFSDYYSVEGIFTKAFPFQPRGRSDKPTAVKKPTQPSRPRRSDEGTSNSDAVLITDDTSS